MVSQEHTFVNISPAERVTSLLRFELEQLAERVADADNRLYRARVLCDQGELEAAETERSAATGAYHAIREQCADLFLLLLRVAIDHRPLQLCEYLRDLVREAIQSDLDALADCIIELRGQAR